MSHVTDQHLNRKKLPPPGRVSFWAYFGLKRREEEGRKKRKEEKQKFRLFTRSQKGDPPPPRGVAFIWGGGDLPPPGGSPFGHVSDCRREKEERKRGKKQGEGSWEVFFLRLFKLKHAKKEIFLGGFFFLRSKSRATHHMNRTDTTSSQGTDTTSSQSNRHTIICQPLFPL